MLFGGRHVYPRRWQLQARVSVQRPGGRAHQEVRHHAEQVLGRRQCTYIIDPDYIGWTGNRHQARNV